MMFGKKKMKVCPHGIVPENDISFCGNCPYGSVCVLSEVRN